jgi:hypothetical protein
VNHDLGGAWPPLSIVLKEIGKREGRTTGPAATVLTFDLALVAASDDFVDPSKN